MSLFPIPRKIIKMFEKIQSKQGGLLPAIRGRRFGDEEIQHMYPEGQRG